MHQVCPAASLSTSAPHDNYNQQLCGLRPGFPWLQNVRLSVGRTEITHSNKHRMRPIPDKRGGQLPETAARAHAGCGPTRSQGGGHLGTTRSQGWGHLGPSAPADPHHTSAAAAQGTESRLATAGASALLGDPEERRQAAHVAGPRPASAPCVADEWHWAGHSTRGADPGQAA